MNFFSLLRPAFNKSWPSQLAVFIAGALLPLSFAPFNLWPISIVALLVLAWFLPNQSAKQVMAYGFLFSLGMFATGIHWTFVPLYQFSSMPVVLDALIILIFVAILAAVFYALPFYCLGRWCSQHPAGILLGLPGIWVITEWLRTWLFTGFPWLFLGYGHLDTWLAGWASITGVMGISFIVCLTATTIFFCWQQFYQQQHCKKKYHKIIRVVGAISFCALSWLGGLIFKNVQWLQEYGEPVKVGLAQGNIPQDKKWEEDFIQPTLDRYQTLTNELWDNDWIVWPEAAIPMVANTIRDHARLQPLLADLKQQAISHNAALITGILYLSPADNKAYNSIIATGLGAGIYFKQRLVPFGEYAPLEDYLGDLFNFFNIRRSMIALGPPNQRGLQVGGAILAPSICYEIVYPDLVAKGAENANVLITISNDAWFGHSIGPLQHMQMARMRALETQRYLIRGTNNGVSALVDDKGQIIVKSDRYVMQSIAGEIELRQGMTPFMVFGSEPIVFLSLVIVCGVGFLQYRRFNKLGR